MLLCIKRADCLDDIVKRCGYRKVFALKRAKPILGQNKDWIRCASGKGGLAYAFHTVQHESGCRDGFILANALDVKRHRILLLAG